MNAARAEIRVRRIVVALDALCENHGALAAGARLAQRWRCDLQGVFVIDADLVHLGELPGVRQVGLSVADCGLLDPVGLAQNLAGLEARARRACAEAARAAGIAVTFAVVHGDMVGAAVDLTEEDLLVVEGSTRAFVGRLRFESRWRRHAAAARQPVLLLRRTTDAGGPVMCLYDGGAAAERALVLAARLAADRDDRLVILAAPGTEPTLIAAVGKTHPHARIRRLDGDSDSTWRQAIDLLAPALIVTPADAPAERWAASTADMLLVP